MSNPLEALRAAWDLVEQAKPVVHYVATDMVPIGKYFRIAARGMFPAVWAFHPTDFEQQRAELAQHARLVDFRTWRPTPEQEAAEWASVIEDLRAHFSGSRDE